jgi:hypothetical protein
VSSNNNAASLFIVLCENEHPDFAARFESTQTNVALKFAAIRCSTYHSSTTDLLAYFIAMSMKLSPLLQDLRRQTASPVSQATLASEKPSVAPATTARPKLTASPFMKTVLHLQLENLYIGVHISEQCSLAGVQVSGFQFDFCEKSNGDKDIALLLSQFNLLDLTPQRGFYGTVASLDSQTRSRLAISIPADASHPLTIQWTSGLFLFTSSLLI